MKRLTEKKIKELIKYYNDYFNWDKKQIAYELAKDFIYNAQLEYEGFLNTHYKEFNTEIFRSRSDLWKQAIEETSEYLEE